MEAQSSEEIFIASEIYHTPYNTLYLSEDTDIKELKISVLSSVIMTWRANSDHSSLQENCVMLPQPGLFGKKLLVQM